MEDISGNLESHFEDVDTFTSPKANSHNSYKLLSFIFFFFSVEYSIGILHANLIELTQIVLRAFGLMPWTLFSN